MGETPVKIERKKISSEGKRKGELTRDKEWVLEVRTKVGKSHTGVQTGMRS